jgi:hypothetical protein
MAITGTSQSRSARISVCTVLQVGPAAEAAAGAGQHDDARLVAAARAIEHVQHLVDHVPAECVHPLRPIHGEGDDAVVVGDGGGFVIHR